MSNDPRRSILITGGQRSGKSRYAEKLARSMTHRPLYLATARVMDEEMKERVRSHQNARGNEWETLEEDLRIGKAEATNGVILVDCITLWITNLLMDMGNDRERILAFARQELDALFQKDASLIFVSNEIGMGLTPTDGLSRNFLDLQGKVNQELAERADELVFMVAGQALPIKR